MNLDTIVAMLVETEDLEKWPEVVSELDGTETEQAFNLARPKWLKRMVLNGDILLNPTVSSRLKDNSWNGDDSVDRMIWANILVLKSGPESKADFQRIKKKIIRKHGRDWWEDVYRRIKPTFAARQRLINQNLSPAVRTLASHSSVVALGVEEERHRALSMIPD